MAHLKSEGSMEKLTNLTPKQIRAIVEALKALEGIKRKLLDLLKE